MSEGTPTRGKPVYVFTQEALISEVGGGGDSPQQGRVGYMKIWKMIYFSIPKTIVNCELFTR
jgi:hypothetical protein